MIQKEEREFLRAVFSNDTNYILKRAVMNLRKWANEMNYKTLVREFVYYLNVDINTCKPIYVDNDEYSKKENWNNIFLFLSENFEIISILEGDIWDNRTLKFEQYKYEKLKKDKYAMNTYDLIKEATHVLMITPEMRNKKKRVNKPLPRFIDEQSAKKDLYRRLYEYRLKKYKNLSYEECTNMLTYSISQLSKYLFAEFKVQEEICNKFIGVFNRHSFVSLLIRELSALSFEIYVERYSFFIEESGRKLDISTKKKIDELKLKIGHAYNIVNKLLNEKSV